MYTDDLFESVYDMECIEYAYESAMLEEFFDDEILAKLSKPLFLHLKRHKRHGFRKLNVSSLNL